MTITYEELFPLVQLSLAMMASPPFAEGQIEELVEEIIEPIQRHTGELIDEAMIVKIVGALKEQFSISLDFGNSINDETHEPWWTNFKSGENELYYWRRFETLLRKKGELPPQVINQLNLITDDIIDLIGNPVKEGVWNRRGMVIGHVQSGKTQNYSAVICKAADAGYKIIILLAGITKDLRRQTQDRINEAFIGRRASQHNALMSQRVGVGLGVGHRAPDAGTFLEGDFNAASLRSVVGFNLANRTEPIIFVCKKNVHTLANLLKYFESFQEEGKIDFPLLLIDDEADNASINTRKEREEVTKTNAGIRSILRKFTRSSYVGYTATPFANIFIDPDDDDDFGADDLFPANYIRTLEAPDNYMGASKIFSPDAPFFERMVTPVFDYEPMLRLKHKKHHQVGELPNSLRKAIIHFILAKTIRVLRGDGKKHCSMMINVSLFKTVQGEVEGLVSTLVNEFSEDIRVNARSSAPSSKSIIHEFEKEYNTEFCEKISNDEFSYPSWEDIRGELFRGWFVEVRTVNSDGGTLDYDNYAENGLTVIAIGGLALSRGLTLEGLCNTYILRNAAAYDTLMQMGRWFGYRTNYEDLCRLYLTQDSIDHYQDTSEAIDELRDEIKFMQSADLTPKQFGLKVRQSPHALRITAANKMRTASTQLVNIGFGGRTVEGHTVFNNQNINSKNVKVTREFLLSLGAPTNSESYHFTEGTRLWTGIKPESILQFLKSFKLPPRCSDLASLGNKDSLVIDFITEKKHSLTNWNVHLNNIVGNVTGNIDDNSEVFGTSIFDGEPLRLRKRTGVVEKDLHKVSNNRKVGTGDDAKVGLPKNIYDEMTSSLSKVQNSQMKQKDEFRPTLIIYFVKPEVSQRNLDGNLLLEKGLVSFVLHFPGWASLKTVEKVYQTNVIWQQLEFSYNSEDEDAEMAELEEQEGS